MEAEPVAAAPLEVAPDAAAAAPEDGFLFAAGGRGGPKRPPINAWEYLIIEDDPTKNELTNEDLEAIN